MKTLFSLLFCLFAIGVTAQVVQIPTVVHVLWNEPQENVADSIVDSTLELLNDDFRRLNADTNQTPVHFQPVAVDTEIEFVLTQEDVNGNTTSGIIHYQTDSAEFYSNYHHMKFDSSGGVDAWNPCMFLNIWIVPYLTDGPNQFVDGFATRSFADQNIDGIVIGHLESLNVPFGSRRRITKLAAYYLNLHPIVTDQNCLDNDSVADTPPSFWNPFTVPTISCGDTINTCNNAVNGDMFMNFVAHDAGTDCMNFFTEGQKERMHNTLNNLRPGLLDPALCGVGIPDLLTTEFSIHPNPTTSSIQLSGINSGNYSILNLNGKTVDSGTFISSSTISVEELPAGLYILKVQTENGVGHQRFVKQ